MNQASSSVKGDLEAVGGPAVGGPSPEDPLPGAPATGEETTEPSDAGARPAAWETLGRRIVVMRHGVTDLNMGNVVQGQLDTPLSPEGVEQARRAAPYVARLEPQLIWSSDLERASVTADEIASFVDVPVRVDARLRESHSGAWQGVAVDELDPKPNWTTFGVHTKRGGTGESVLDVVERVRPLLAELFEQLPPHGVALLVTHGVTARVITAETIGMDQETAWRSLAGLRNCAWAVLEEATYDKPSQAGRHLWRLRQWNVTAPEQADLGLRADSG